MNHYLFVFPEREFFYTNPWFRDMERGHPDVLALVEGVCKEMRLIIDTRYRNKGYEIDWLLFSNPHNYEQPDLNSVEERVGILEKDRKLVAGISWNDMTRGGMHPDSDYVLSQLPNVEKLVLGGFHQADCVDKIASAAIKKGISVILDEDTTDYFLLRKAHGIKIPVERNRWSLADFGMTREQGADDFDIASFKESRRDKPYLVKV